MLEAIRIRKAGYAVRIQMKEFVARYKHIFGSHGQKHFTNDIALKDQVQKILEDKLRAEEGEEQLWQIGLTKVFMKEQGQKKLEVDLQKAL